MEKAAEEGASSQAGRAPGPGQGPGFARGPGRGLGRRRGAGRPSGARASLKDTPAPEFRLMPGSVKTYMLSVPTDTPLKIVPQGIRPTIRMEGHHIAFSSTAEAARTALETIKKNGKPGPDVEQVLSHAPSGTVLLAVGDTRETVPSLLASLPGTLQARINSVITLSAGGSAGSVPGGAGPGPPGARPGFGPGGSGGFDPRGRMGPGGPGMSGRPGFSGSSGQPGGQMVGTATAAGGSQDAMVQLRVDAAKLPKAEELKALMFPETLAVVVDDASIRLVSRESFPDVVNGLHLATGFAPGLLPAFNAAWARAWRPRGRRLGRPRRLPRRTTSRPWHNLPPAVARCGVADAADPGKRAVRVEADPSDVRPASSPALSSTQPHCVGDRSMEIVNEVTAHLENKPGRLAKICSALAQEKVDIRAITVMETEGPSVLRFVTTDLETTKKVLTSLGTEYRISEVLAVGLENRTGTLAKVLEKLAEEHINIEYAYASTAANPGKALGIFHTTNTKRALQILGEAAGNSAEKAGGRRPLHSR